MSNLGIEDIPSSPSQISTSSIWYENGSEWHDEIAGTASRTCLSHPTSLEFTEIEIIGCARPMETKKKSEGLVLSISTGKWWNPFPRAILY